MQTYLTFNDFAQSLGTALAAQSMLISQLEDCRSR
jgi:hypothetical protein